MTTEPVALYINNDRGFKVGDLSEVDSGNDWFWESNSLYLYSTVDPDTLNDPGIEATNRACIIFDGDSHLTVDGLHIIKGQDWGICFVDESNENIVQNCIIEYSGLVGIGCNDKAGNNSIGNLIRNNTIRYNGQNGVYLGQRAYDWIVDGNTVYDNCENLDIHTANGGGGIKAGGNLYQISGGHVIQNNIVFLTAS